MALALIFVFARATSSDINDIPDAFVLKARNSYYVLNKSKELLEDIFVKLNNLTDGIKRKNLSFVHNGISFKIGYFVGNKACPGFDYTIVMWKKSFSETNYKRTLEASFSQNRTIVYIKTIPEYVLKPLDSLKLVYENLSISGRFNLNKQTAQIFVSHSTQSQDNVYLETLPPYSTYRAKVIDGSIMITSASYWPNDINEVGYIDPGVPTYFGKINSMAGYVLKTVSRFDINDDVGFLTGNIIPDGENDVQTSLNEALPHYNYPAGTSNGTFLLMNCLVGKGFGNIPDIYRPPADKFYDYYDQYSKIANIKGIEMITGRELVDNCRSISLYSYNNQGGEYIYDNYDGYYDNPPASLY